MIRLRYILFLVVMLVALPSVAQDKNMSPQEVFSVAQNDFSRGYFGQAEQELKSVVKSLKGLHKTSAYRIMALCAIEAGRYDDAQQYIDLMLKNDPYYTPTLDDPQRLVDMISAAKSKSAGITTASRQAESIDEAPVPVTLITEDMIRFSGAQTLQELLCLYVPGMSNIEGMESNIAMHGVYDLSQNKILFLQDGHRLNGSSTNAEAPDYRNSLDKIKQIEVLRGPASSLYGNVALTAVVNIITHKGYDLDGGRISGVVGTQNTYGGSFVVGGGNNVVDILGWGNVFTSGGFAHTKNNALGGTTTLYTGAYDRRPSYDVGIKARWGDFTMTVNSQRSKKTPYVNILQLSPTQDVLTNPQYRTKDNPWGVYGVGPINDYNAITNYNVDNYDNVGSNGPGITRTNHHINLDYNHSFENIDFQASGYVSMEHTSLYNVMGDSVSKMVGVLLISKLGTGYSSYDQSSQETLLDFVVKTRGVFQVMEWENISLGGQAQMTAKYNFLGHGYATLGVQYDHFALTNGTLYLGGNGSSEQMISSGSVFEDGMEDVFSGYLQVKHYFTDNIIVNAGLRFDDKRRFNSETISRFSPRLSLIYKITPTLSARASYNYSFVDAPYLYRACNVSMYSGGPYMEPETMRSWQAGLSFTTHDSRLHAEVSGFYNQLDNLITQSVSMSTGYLFVNAGKVKQTGVDVVAQYTMPRFFASVNATWQKVLDSDKYNVYMDNRVGVPQFMGNIVAAWAPYVGKGSGFFGAGKLWLNANASMQSKTYYQSVDVLSSYFYKTPYGAMNEVPATILLGVGVTYEWKYLDLSIMAKNLTNNEYMMGSVLSDGIPHTGRQILGKVTIKF